MGVSPEQWDRVKDLYVAALECDPDQRADFLQGSTTDDVVRAEVGRLLAERDRVGSFLSTPPFVDCKTHTENSPKLFVPGDMLAERFRIISFMAAGGMGEVYQAEDLVLRENLAIKTIRPEILQQSNALARFKREVQLARRVTHPNVCRVFDLFWHKSAGGDGATVVFVSMELLQGETLSERIRRTGRLSPEQALPLIEQIASGLEAAHRVEIVHRDLKPGNVMLVPNACDGQIRSVITDFGLALRTGVDAKRSVDFTTVQGIIGTPAYMAPEQIEGKEVTKKADIYALGLIIYEMVTGQHAFPADTPLASAVKRFSDPLASPKQIAPELGDNWEHTIRRCLQRDPSARHASALEVAKALSRQPSSAARLTSALSGHELPGSGSRWRRRLALGMGTLALAGIVLATNFYSGHRRSAAVTPSPQAVPNTRSAGAQGTIITSLVVEKNAGLNPEEEGFEVHSIGKYETKIMPNISNQGYDRWQITSTDQTYYYRTLNTSEKNFALSHDWRLTCVCAVKQGLAHANIVFSPGWRRFDIALLREGHKFYVALTKQLAPQMEWEQKLEFPGVGDIEHPHTYELRYDHSTQAAGLWIDGREVASGYHGHTQFVEDRGLVFGSASYLAAKTGVGVFRSVRFEAH